MFVPLSTALVLLACSSGSGNSPVADAGTDGETKQPARDAAEEPPPIPEDAGSDACTPCAFSLKVQLNGITKPMDRTQYGYDDATKTLLYMEAHAGGKPECPEPKSPSPDRTLVLSGIRVDQKTSYAEGARVTLLDFKGELTTEPAVKATAVTFTPVACCLLPGQTAFKVDATLPNGQVTGTFVADHCDSLDTM